MITTNPKLDLYTIVLLIGHVQGIFLTYFFFINRKQNPANIFLGCLILVLTLSLTEVFLNYSGLMLSILHLHNFSEPLQFLVGPLLYFYVRAYTSKKMQTIQYLHLIPFIFYLAYMSLEYTMPIIQKYNSYIHGYYPEEELIPITNYQGHDPWNIKSFLTTVGIALHLLLYFFLSLNLLKHEALEKLKAFFSKNKTPEQSKWIINFILISSVGIILLPLSKYSFKVVNGENIIGVYITLFIYLIGFSIIRRSTFFAEKKTKKYHTSTLSEEWINQKMTQLNALMEKEKPFIKNTFSRSDLASQLSISEHRLSQMINAKTNTNFFGMINRYRTLEAKKMLDDPHYDNLTIEQIAYDVGYNSKSAFYTAFKKEFNTTPHAYRKSK